MQFEDKTIVITGGSQGIGLALAKRFARRGSDVWILDLNPPDGDVTRKFGHIQCDVSDETALTDALGVVSARQGEIDVFVSNAGVMSHEGGHVASASIDDWSRCWSVNVMAHVHAARVLLPGMLARQEGYFVILASAAGLLNQIGDAAYSATKHAAVSFAESMAIAHSDDGIGVSVACPQYVATSLIGLEDRDAQDRASLLTAGQVADSVLNAMEKGKFLVLPHPEVSEYATLRAQDHEAWIEGMRRLRRRARDAFGRVAPEDFYKLV